MPFVQGSEIARYHAGSYEQRILALQALVESTTKKAVSILATHPEHALVVDAAGKFLRVDYVERDGEFAIKTIGPADVRVVEDADLPRFLGDELRVLVSEGFDNRVDRTRVRDLVTLLRPGEHYWLDDVLEKIDEAAVPDAPWLKLTEEQDLGAAVDMGIPATRYTRLPEGSLDKFYAELHESVGLLAGVFRRIVDEATALVFDDEKKRAVRGSLIVEAQATVGLLSKAEKLMAPSGAKRTAQAHDRLAERAKNMVAVLSWLRPRTPKDEE